MGFYRISGWMLLTLVGVVTIGNFLNAVGKERKEDRILGLVCAILGCWFVWFLITTLKG